VAAAVAAVTTPHAMTMTPIQRPMPRREKRRADGIMNTPYVTNINADASPTSCRVSPTSWMREGAARPMEARSMKVSRTTTAVTGGGGKGVAVGGRRVTPAAPHASPVDAH